LRNSWPNSRGEGAHPGESPGQGSAGTKQVIFGEGKTVTVPKDCASVPCRCAWAGSDPLYLEYHDREWGVPVHDDRRLFEFLILEGAQAGLSWLTILRKREAYRAAFAGFDPEAVARFGVAKVAALLANPGIVRNRLKVESAISNARAFLQIQEEFGSFAAYQWGFVEGGPICNAWKTIEEVPPFTPVSDALSRDLKRRGFRFVGSTICYAHMQAVGMVNDHTVDCFRWRELAADPPLDDPARP
jgi:DNA-3-methyladenine glycosylase I